MLQRRIVKLMIPALIFASVALVAWQYSYSENNKKAAVWPNKSDFNALRRHSRELAFVYSKQSAQASEFKKTLEKLAHRRRYSRIIPKPIEQLHELDESISLCFIGTPLENAAIRAFLQKSELNFAIDQTGIQFNGNHFSGADLLFMCALPNTDYPGRYFRLITAAQSQTLLTALQRENRPPQLIGDFSIYQNEQLIAYGFFKQNLLNQPWKVGRLIELRESAPTGAIGAENWFNVQFVGEKPPQQLLDAYLESRSRLVDKLLHTLQIDRRKRARILPLNLNIYETTELKFLATNKTGFSSWDKTKNTIAVVLNDRIPGHDFSAIAECLLEKAIGPVQNKKVLQAAGILFSDHWGELGYKAWAGRLYHQKLFAELPEYLQESSPVSNMAGSVTLASYLAYLLENNDISIFRDILAKMPSSDRNHFTGFFPQEKLAAWRRWCQQKLPKIDLPAIDPINGFLAGFCYAHEGYNIFNGYLGSASESALQKLSTLHVNAISLTPFAYFGAKKYLHKSDGVRQENDESLVVAAQYARALGMKIILKPHIWVSWRSWPGEIEFKTEAEADRFFESYGNLMLHYAMLAQMHRFESLCIGVEFVKLTQQYENRWRDLIADIRKVYTGQLIYAANWGQEFENIKFWDALDAIGLNSYYPLSNKKEYDRLEMEKSIRDIFKKIRRVKQKFNRPVYFTEVGFASRLASWMDPHVDGRNQKVDLEAQKQCYEILLPNVLKDRVVDGMFIWKWPTHLGVGGSKHSSFTPNGKPAEQIIRMYYHKLLQ